MIKCKLKVLLADREYTQEEFAELIGVGRNVVNRFANSRCGSYNVYITNKMCEVLDCTIADLFVYIPDEKREGE